MTDRPRGGPEELLLVVPGLYRVAYALCGNRLDAEDLVHSAIERYLATARVTPSDLSAYLRRTMTNLHLNAVKRRGIHDRSVRTLSNERPLPGGVESSSDVFGALQLLDPLPRAVIVLRYLADLPVGEVAKILGRPAGTIPQLAQGPGKVGWGARFGAF